MSDLDAVSWYNTVIFDNLDPDKEYTITLSANRRNYSGARYTKVTFEGADINTNESPCRCGGLRRGLSVV